MMSVLRPQHDPYRSLPSTPIGIDPRNGSIDINSAMNHARLGLEVQDYFSGSPRFSGNLRPRSPYPHEYESESGAYTSNSSFAVSDMNPTNLAAFVNRCVIKGNPNGFYLAGFRSMMTDFVAFCQNQSRRNACQRPNQFYSQIRQGLSSYQRRRSLSHGFQYG